MGTREHTYGREPNTRRQFFGLLAMGAAAVGLGSLLPEKQALRTVERYSYATDSWHRVRMYELRAGDVFRIEECGTFIAQSDPARQPDGVWGVQASYEIDPATNAWVPCKGA